jgi:hypothetical protein
MNQDLKLHGRHKAKASIEEENKRRARVHVRREKWEYKILIFFFLTCGLLFLAKLGVFLLVDCSREKSFFFFFVLILF